jgi:phosphoribosylformylglycinamidine synthase
MTPNDTFLALDGPSALSSFRAARLLGRLQAIEPGIQAVAARHIHFVHLNGPAQPVRAKLDALLTYGEPFTASVTDADSFDVVPRLGTISPWASKATDIAHNCGLAALSSGRARHALLRHAEIWPAGRRPPSVGRPRARPWPPSCMTG